MEDYSEINKICEKIVRDIIEMFRLVNPFYIVDLQAISKLKNYFIKTITERGWPPEALAIIVSKSLIQTKKDIDMMIKINPYTVIYFGNFMEIFGNHIDNITKLILKDVSKTKGYNTKLQLDKQITYAVFICHADEDKKLANLIKNLLEDFNITSFVAHDDIQKGEPWQPAIIQAMEKSNVVLAIGTKLVEKSAWVNFETGLGYEKMFPFLLDELSDCVSYIKNKQGIIFNHNDIKKSIMSLIFEVMTKMGITTDKTPESILGLKTFIDLEEHLINNYKKIES